MKLLLTFLLLFLYNLANSEERKCFDFQLLDGAEPLIYYGMDTTYNWYAITQPFQNRFRLIVNGEELESMLNVSVPVFSQDGERWAAFAEDNVGWMLFTEEDMISFNATSVGDVVFSEDSKVLAYSYYEGTLAIIKLGDKEFSDYRKKKGLWIDHKGEKIAYIIENANQEVVKVNDKQINSFDKVYPVGFWEDGGFIYVGEIGGYFQVYKDKEPFSDMYQNIPDIKINRKGDVLAFIALQMGNRYVATLISDEFAEPIVSDRYDMISDLNLHPTAAIMSYSAVLFNAFTINMNLTKYFSAEFNSSPQFTWNGDELYFIGCRINCFFSINGQNFNTETNLPVDRYYARKPDSDSFAFSTNSALIVRYISNGEMRSGMMVNNAIEPRYNRFDDRYEALGVINDRLYLLTCRD
jgi:hypothetical protein